MLPGRGAGRVSTLSQLAALNRGPGAAVLKCSKSLLMIPDLFRYFLWADFMALLSCFLLFSSELSVSASFFSLDSFFLEFISISSSTCLNMK